MNPLTFVIAFVLGAATILPGNARNVEVPTYDELFAKADFIVIAHPVSKTRDTREDTLLTHNISPGVPARGVVTEFECLYVIKGTKQHRFTLHHYRLAPSPQMVIINGPNFVRYGPKPVTQPFLMFLVRERDGRFAPVAGQVDPDLSVQQLPET